MAKKCRLTEEERALFTLVNRAVFANPFTDARAELDLKIAGVPSAASEIKRIGLALERIARKVAVFEREGRADINCYTGKDRILAEISFLFEFFHRFLDRFDAFIQDQITAGKNPLKVPFAREAYHYLQKRGFELESICRYFEVLYQLRRAYFFIDRNLVGRSRCMRALRRKLWNNVFTQDLDLYNRYLWNRMEDFATLLLGETGTGKGTAAAAIGRSGFIPFDEKSGRFVESFTESFITLNLSEYPENLIESELFGHRKGAFTGAVEDFEGIFDRCSSHGAIFLDEIGEVSVPVQIKLLQVIQERVFSPVGSHARHRFRGRVIAATNRPIEKLRQKGRMRDDFYYRLCSDLITVPPLRQRIQEDPAELDDLLALLVTRMLGSPSAEITGMVRQVIERQLGKDYAWPGNVRELEQCIRSILLNQRYTGQTGSQAQDLTAQLVENLTAGKLEAQQLLAGYCAMLHQRHHTYEAVARITRLDRRTVKKYVDGWEEPE